MSVDLPAPLSPRRQCTSPFVEIEGHIVERNDLAEILAHILEGDDGMAHQLLFMARLRT